MSLTQSLRVRSCRKRGCEEIERGDFLLRLQQLFWHNLDEFLDRIGLIAVCDEKRILGFNDDEIIDPNKATRLPVAL